MGAPSLGYTLFYIRFKHPLPIPTLIIQRLVAIALSTNLRFTGDFEWHTDQAGCAKNRVDYLGGGVRTVRF